VRPSGVATAISSIERRPE
jgi:fatty acid desaturase